MKKQIKVLTKIERDCIKARNYGFKQGIKKAEQLIDGFNGREYTDYEIWESMKEELKKKLSAELRRKK